MEELRERARALIARYTPALNAKGLQIALSKRYMESDVCKRSGGRGVAAIFNSIDRARDRWEEEKQGYNYEKNKYHYLILTLCPTEPGSVVREECREYAFVLRKVERAHIGLAPREVIYREDRILSGIEKWLQRVLKRAEKTSAERMCRNGILDAFRYALHPKYEYKERFLGKDRSAWETIFLAVGCILIFGGLFLLWLFTK